MAIKKLTNQKSTEAVSYDMCHFCMDIYPSGEQHDCEPKQKGQFALLPGKKKAEKEVGK